MEDPALSKCNTPANGPQPREVTYTSNYHTLSMKDNWKTKPISPTCEVLRYGRQCGRKTVKAYPAHPGGWMSLCEQCAGKHPEAFDISQLLKQGEAITHGQKGEG